MPDLEVATINEIVEELIGRESFAGAVVIATLGENGARDSVAPYYSDSLADSPSWRKRALLERASQFIGSSPALS